MSMVMTKKSATKTLRHKAFIYIHLHLYNKKIKTLCLSDLVANQKTFATLYLCNSEPL